MSYNLGTADNPVIVFVNFANGILDAVVRADDEATFFAAAIHAGLYYEVSAGEYALPIGVSIDPIGPVMLTSGTYDADGAEITAPTFDTRHHANIRMMAPAIDQVDEHGIIRWHIWSMMWTLGGSDNINPNASEVGKALHGVTLINADTIHSPSQVWYDSLNDEVL